MRPIAVLSVLIFATDPARAADPAPPKPASELHAIKELPNPFVFADGAPVRTKEDWARRRVELNSLFQDYQYGHLPPQSQKMTIQRGNVVRDEENKVGLHDLERNLEHDGNTLKLHVRVVWPADSQGPAPFSDRCRETPF